MSVFDIWGKHAWAFAIRGSVILGFWNLLFAPNKPPAAGKFWRICVYAEVQSGFAT